MEPKSTVKLVKNATGNRRRGLRFANEEGFLLACRILEALKEQQGLEYEIVAGSEAVVLPARYFDVLAPYLNDSHVDFREVKVIPLNRLAPEEQAAKRGLLRKTQSA